jgi:hypothetical protein
MILIDAHCPPIHSLVIHIFPLRYTPLYPVAGHYRDQHTIHQSINQVVTHHVSPFDIFRFSHTVHFIPFHLPPRPMSYAVYISIYLRIYRLHIFETSNIYLL